MAIRPGRRWLKRMLAIVLVIGCLAGLTAWRYWRWREKYAVPLPPPGASPGQVVVAYLRALNALDQTTADALSAPSEQSTTANWLHSTASITSIRIASVQHFGGVCGLIRPESALRPAVRARRHAATASADNRAS